MSFVGSASSPLQFPRDGRPEVAFLGRSNVGKSTSRAPMLIAKVRHSVSPYAWNIGSTA